jgi:hypothetical protein
MPIKLRWCFVLALSVAIDGCTSSAAVPAFSAALVTAAPPRDAGIRSVQEFFAAYGTGDVQSFVRVMRAELSEQVPRDESRLAARFELASPKARAYTLHGAPGSAPARQLQPATSAEVVPNPAANAWCTADDLLRFARALLNDILVSATMRQTLFTSRHAIEGGGALGETYAYGFFLTGTAQTPRIGHGGETPGRNVFFEMLPSLPAVVIVLANLDPPAASWIGERIVHWIAPEL